MTFSPCRISDFLLNTDMLDNIPEMWLSHFKTNKGCIMSGKAKKNEKLLNATEAASYAGISRTTLARYLMSGHLPSQKDKEGHYWIKQSDLDHLKDNRPAVGRPTSNFIKGQKVVKLGEEAFKKVSIISIQQGRSKEEIITDLIEQAYAANMKHLKSL